MEFAGAVSKAHVTRRMAGIKPDLPAAGFSDKLMAISVNKRDLWQITNKKPVIIAGVMRAATICSFGKAETG